MTRVRLLWIVFSIILVLLVVAACGPPRAWPTRTALPSTSTPIAMDTPSAVPSPLAPASATITPIVEVSPTTATTNTPGAVPTATPLPPTPTFTSTSLPASPTVTSTPVPPTPTFTRTPLPPTATATAVSTVAITDWRGEYFANRSLQTPSSLVRNDRVVDLALESGRAPAAGMPAENWSARWSRTWTFGEGNYRFHLLVDDGARLWVAGRLLIDAWADGSAREFTADLYLKGDVPIRLEYYNHLGAARARLNWEQITQFSGWKGSYYAVSDLSGNPVFQRDDPAIRFNWGNGSPRADIPADNFSVRWTRQLAFSQAGSYRFRVEADDGVRLWIDGALVIDSWRDGYSLDSPVVALSAGTHGLRMDFYEHTGGALAQLSWELVTPTPTSAPTQTPITKPTATALPTLIPLPSPTWTATPSPSPTSTATAMPTGTSTATPTPTPTATPTDTPPAVNAVIGLEPAAGPLAVPFDVQGRGWPPNSSVDLLLSRPAPIPGEPELVLQVLSDGEGRFVAELIIPEDQGWEGLASALVIARASDGTVQAEATYRLLPQLTKVRFGRIPSLEERFALHEPVYLVLDSEAAWAQWFGSEPPPVDPPLDWERELVVGAFLGAQSNTVKVDVARVVQRDRTVSTWLTIVIPQELVPASDVKQIPRVLVRIPRDGGIAPSKRTDGDLQFAFLDASGQLLALGPAGEEPLSLPTPELAMQSLELAPAEPPAEASQEKLVEATTEAAAPLLEAPAVERAVTATPTPISIPAGEEGSMPVRTVGGWLLLGLGVVLVVGLVVAAGFVLRRILRSR